MSGLRDRLRSAEAMASVRMDSTALDAIGASVSRRARRRRVLRRVEVSAAVAAAVALGATAGWSLTHREDPIAPKPSATESVTPAPLPSPSPSPTTAVTPPPLAVPDVPYQVTDGVTVSQYLPSASRATGEVWGRVGSGWVLAAYEGGLLDSGRVVADGVYQYSEAGDAVRGVRVLYLVSPAGEVFEVANLTDEGVGDVIAWDVARGKALVTNGVADVYAFAEIDVRVLDLVSGEFGPWFLLSEHGNGVPKAAPVDGAWFIGTTTLVDDRGARLATGLAVDGASTADWLDGWLVQSYLYQGGRPVSGSSLYVSDGWEWPVTEVPAPLDPGGNAPAECRASRVASPDVVAYECIGWAGEPYVGEPVTTLATLGSGERTMTVLVPWDGAAASRTFRWSEVGCIRDAVAYETLTSAPDGGPDLPPPMNEGLWVRTPGAETRVAGPVGQAPPQRCVGAQGADLVIAGAGPIWAYDASGPAAWRTLLPVAGVRADATGARHVVGVTDLGVFVAP